MVTNDSLRYPKRLWWRNQRLPQRQWNRESQDLICGDIDHEYRVTNFITRFFYLPGGDMYLRMPFLQFVKSTSDQSNSQAYLKRYQLDIPSSVLEISVLYHLEPHLQTVILSHNSNLKRIRPASFFRMNSIKLVLIPRSVLKISHHAFCSSGLTQLIFSRNAKVTSFAKDSFKNTVNLSSVVIPKSVENIGNDCFSRSKLHSVLVSPDSTLGKRVFEHCTNLQV